MSEDNDIQALMGFSGFGEVLDILIFFFRITVLCFAIRQKNCNEI